jgi:hypothetical protein
MTMKLELDLRKDIIRLDAFNAKSPILTIGPITIYLNKAQTQQLTELLRHFCKSEELRR